MSASHYYVDKTGLAIDLLEASGNARTTNKGCIDMAVLCFGAVWLFEFKVVELVPQGRALQQLQDRGYADKYRSRGEPIHLVGVEFSKADRNIVGFEVETLA